MDDQMVPTAGPAVTTMVVAEQTSRRQSFRSQRRADETREGDELDLEQVKNLAADKESKAQGLEDVNAVIVLGKTRTGKSTWLNFMASRDVRVVQVELGKRMKTSVTRLDCENPIKRMKVSHTDAAETVDVAHFSVGALHFVDTPGFYETRGVTQEIANCVGITEGIRRCASIRIVLVLNVNELLVPRGVTTRELLQLLTRFVPDIWKKAESIVPIFTHVEEKDTKDLVTALENLMETIGQDAIPLLCELDSKLVSPTIEIFKKVLEGEEGAAQAFKCKFQELLDSNRHRSVPSQLVDTVSYVMILDRIVAVLVAHQEKLLMRTPLFKIGEEQPLANRRYELMTLIESTSPITNPSQALQSPLTPQSLDLLEKECGNRFNSILNELSQTKYPNKTRLDGPIVIAALSDIEFLAKRIKNGRILARYHEACSSIIDHAAAQVEKAERALEAEEPFSMFTMLYALRGFVNQKLQKLFGEEEDPESNQDLLQKRDRVMESLGGLCLRVEEFERQLEQRIDDTIRDLSQIGVNCDHQQCSQWVNMLQESLDKLSHLCKEVRGVLMMPSSKAYKTCRNKVSETFNTILKDSIQSVQDGRFSLKLSQHFDLIQAIACSTSQVVHIDHLVDHLGNSHSVTTAYQDLKEELEQRISTLQEFLLKALSSENLETDKATTVQGKRDVTALKCAAEHMGTHATVVSMDELVADGESTTDAIEASSVGEEEDRLANPRPPKRTRHFYFQTETTTTVQLAWSEVSSRITSRIDALLQESTQWRHSQDAEQILTGVNRLEALVTVMSGDRLDQLMGLLDHIVDDAVGHSSSIKKAMEVQEEQSATYPEVNHKSLGESCTSLCGTVSILGSRMTEIETQFKGSTTIGEREKRLNESLTEAYDDLNTCLERHFSTMHSNLKLVLTCPRRTANSTEGGTVEFVTGPTEQDMTQTWKLRCNRTQSQETGSTVNTFEELRGGAWHPVDGYDLVIGELVMTLTGPEQSALCGTYYSVSSQSTNQWVAGPSSSLQSDLNNGFDSLGRVVKLFETVYIAAIESNKHATVVENHVSKLKEQFGILAQFVRSSLQAVCKDVQQQTGALVHDDSVPSLTDLILNLEQVAHSLAAVNAAQRSFLGRTGTDLPSLNTLLPSRQTLSKLQSRLHSSAQAAIKTLNNLSEQLWCCFESNVCSFRYTKFRPKNFEETGVNIQKMSKESTASEWNNFVDEHPETSSIVQHMGFDDDLSLSTLREMFTTANEVFHVFTTYQALDTFIQQQKVFSPTRQECLTFAMKFFAAHKTKCQTAIHQGYLSSTTPLEDPMDAQYLLAVLDVFTSVFVFDATATSSPREDYLQLRYFGFKPKLSQFLEEAQQLFQQQNYPGLADLLQKHASVKDDGVQHEYRKMIEKISTSLSEKYRVVNTSLDEAMSNCSHQKKLIAIEKSKELLVDLERTRPLASVRGLEQKLATWDGAVSERTTRYLQSLEKRFRGRLGHFKLKQCCETLGEVESLQLLPERFREASMEKLTSDFEDALSELGTTVGKLLDSGNCDTVLSVKKIIEELDKCEEDGQAELWLANTDGQIKAEVLSVFRQRTSSCVEDCDRAIDSKDFDALRESQMKLSTIIRVIGQELIDQVTLTSYEELPQRIKLLQQEVFTTEFLCREGTEESLQPILMKFSRHYKTQFTEKVDELCRSVEREMPSKEARMRSSEHNSYFQKLLQLGIVLSHNGVSLAPQMSRIQLRYLRNLQDFIEENMKRLPGSKVSRHRHTAADMEKASRILNQGTQVLANLERSEDRFKQMSKTTGAASHELLDVFRELMNVKKDVDLKLTNLSSGNTLLRRYELYIMEFSLMVDWTDKDVHEQQKVLRELGDEERLAFILDQQDEGDVFELSYDRAIEKLKNKFDDVASLPQWYLRDPPPEEIEGTIQRGGNPTGHKQLPPLANVLTLLRRLQDTGHPDVRSHAASALKQLIDELIQTTKSLLSSIPATWQHVLDAYSDGENPGTTIKNLDIQLQQFISMVTVLPRLLPSNKRLEVPTTADLVEALLGPVKSSCSQVTRFLQHEGPTARQLTSYLVGVYQPVSQLKNVPEALVDGTRAAVSEVMDRVVEFLNKAQSSGTSCKLKFHELWDEFEATPEGAELALELPQFKTLQMLKWQAIPKLSFTDAMEELKKLNPDLSEGDAQKLIDAYEVFNGAFMEEAQEPKNFTCRGRDLLTARARNEIQRGEKPSIAIPRLIGRVFACWSIATSSKASVVETGGSTPVMREPLPSQVLALFRLLGVPEGADIKPAAAGKVERFLAQALWFSAPGIDNHLVQVKTGQGKSVILGVMSTVLALHGWSVDCVCYSKYLSERDFDDFKAVFDAFGVSKKIHYGVFEELCERQLNRNGNIRSLTKQLAGLPLSPEEEGELQRAASTNNDPTVLLIDEVDVFFTSTFYGNTYDPVALYTDPDVVELVCEIWKTRTQGRCHAQSLPCFQRLVQKNPTCEPILKSHTDRMLDAVQNFNPDEFPYELVEANGQTLVAYRHGDTSSVKITHGYQTSFLYLYLWENGGKVSEEVAHDHCTLQIECGSFSYAELPKRYNLILGVTGTLCAPGSQQDEIVQKEFQVHKRTIMPDIYCNPNSANVFQRGSTNAVVVAENTAVYNQKILACILDVADPNKQGGAIVVFFDTEKDMKAWWHSQGSVVKQAGCEVQLVVSSKNCNINARVRAATRRNTVTLMPREFGRGLDFCVHDQHVKKNGLYVLSTFLPSDPSEEIQLMGRTARQDQNGTFSMILRQSDLVRDIKADPSELASRQSNGTLYEYLDTHRRKAYEKGCLELRSVAKEALQRHRKSLLLIDAFPGAPQTIQGQAFGHLKAINKSSAKICRLMFLSDATGSMGGVWKSAKHAIKHMIHRIMKVTDGKAVVEMMWVAFWDYDALLANQKVVKHSAWTKDPNELLSFVNSIKLQFGPCYDDNDGQEAVEKALAVANKEQPTRVILLGDAAPHPHKTGKELTVRENGLTITMETDYVEECKKLRKKDIQVSAYYFAKRAQESFEKISQITKGPCAEHLSPDNQKQLLDRICQQALDDLGGAELVEKYNSIKWT